MFEFAYDMQGDKSAEIYPAYIPGATNVKQGAVTVLTPGTGLALAAAALTTASAGITLEQHDGSTKGRQSGNEIKISTSPSAVYRLKPQKYITATGGSTTTFVDSALTPATNDIFKGGYIIVRTCAADPTLVGKKIKITGSTGATGTLTFAAQASAFAAGDTAYVCPGKLAVSQFGWRITATADDIDWETSGATGIVLVDVDPENFLTYWKLRLTQFGDAV